MKKKIKQKKYSISQPVQLVFTKKLLTPCLKLEIPGSDLTINGGEFPKHGPSLESTCI